MGRLPDWMKRGTGLVVILASLAMPAYTGTTCMLAPGARMSHLHSA